MSQARYIADFVIQSNNIADGAVTFADVGALYTSNVTENTSLYFTNARATAAVVAGAAANSILFVSSAGVLANSNTLVWTGSNLGIGTGTPTTRLDVVNASGRAARIGGFQFGGTTTSADGGNNLLSSGVYWNGTNLTATQTTGAVLQLANGALQFQALSGLTAGNTYSYAPQMALDSSGNLGIGTGSPSARLHINGTSDATQRIIVNGTGNFSSYKLNYNGSEVAFIQSYQNTELNFGTAVNAPILFYVNNAEQMRLTTTGLGIGTNSPGAKLHVLGSGDPAVATISIKAGLANHNPLTSTQQYGLYVDQLGGRYAPQTGVYVNVNNPNGLYGGPYYGVDTYVTSSAQAYQKAYGVRGKAENLQANYGTQAYGVKGEGISAESLGGTIVQNSQGAWGGHFTAYGKGNSVGVYADAYLTASSIAGAVAIPLLVASNGIECVRITSAGVLDLATGAGAVGQIKFPATQVASADANTLDDYEEGSWTPDWRINGSPTGSWITKTGRYTKVGNMVTIWAYFFTVGGRGSGTGQVSITGLPFISKNTDLTNYHVMDARAGVSWSSGGAGLPFLYQPANDYKLIAYQTNNSTSSFTQQMSESNFSASGFIELNIMMTYETN